MQAGAVCGLHTAAVQTAHCAAVTRTRSGHSVLCHCDSDFTGKNLEVRLIDRLLLCLSSSGTFEPLPIISVGVHCLEVSSNHILSCQVSFQEAQVHCSSVKQLHRTGVSSFSHSIRLFIYPNDHRNRHVLTENMGDHDKIDIDSIISRSVHGYAKYCLCLTEALPVLISWAQFSKFVTIARFKETIVFLIHHRLLEVRGSRPGRNVQLTENEIRGLCLKSREIFLSQPILLELEAPLKICGKGP